MNNPLVVITSKVHVPRMRAHKILLENGYDNWVMVVDNEEQFKRAVAEAGVPEDRVVVAMRPTNLPPQDGIAWIRQYVEDVLVPRDTWYVSLDDNVGGWTWLPRPWCQADKINFEAYPQGTQIGDFDHLNMEITTSKRAWRALYETPCPFPEVVRQWKELIVACEGADTLAGGFAIETNYFFRGNRWQRFGYVRAQNAVWKNTGLPFYYWPGAMLEDFVRSVDVVVRCGSVLINRYVKPQKEFFEAGGIGTFEERRPNLVACCQELMRRYPGLLKEVKGRDYSLTFATRNIPAWRAVRDVLERTGAR